MRVFPRQRVKTKMLSIRVSSADYDFLKMRKLSATKIFDGALMNCKKKRRRD